MKKILLLEDDQDYRRIMTEILSTSGFFVVSSPDGGEGLALIQKETIDLILLDLHMPKVDGVGFYYKLTHILKKQIPLIILTNDTDAVAYGSDIKEVLIKAHVTPEDVLSTVRKYL